MKWKHNPLNAQNPLKFMKMLNDISEYLAMLSETLEERKVLDPPKKPGRPKTKVEEPQQEN